MRFTGVAVIFMVSVISFAGCASSMRYSDEEIKSYPPKIQEYIKAGEIATGMTKMQVRYSRGGPDEVSELQPTEDGKERVRWVYKSMLAKERLYFTDGILTEIVTSKPGFGN